MLYAHECNLLTMRLFVQFREDRPHLKIPKSFLELQALNTLLKKYRDIYPYRIVVCYVTTYLLLVPLYVMSYFDELT